MMERGGTRPHVKTISGSLCSTMAKQAKVSCICITVSCLFVQLTTGISLSSTVHLAEGYDRNVPPKPESGEGPLTVNVSLDLESVYDVVEKTQMISAAIILRLIWNDTRVNVTLPDDDPFGYVLRTRDSIKDLWFPDVFVANTKDVRMPSFGISPQYLRIYPGGHMIHSSLANFDLHCAMDFKRYPVDVQDCDMVFESYSTVSKAIDLQWHMFEKNAHKMNQHTLDVSFESSRKTYMTGTFSRLTMHVKLKRDLNFHMTRTFIPSFLYATLAWASLFIPCNLLPGRVAVGITTLLTLASMYNSLLSITPPISYITKLDVWIFGCFLMVCATLLETIVVVYVRYNHLVSESTPITAVTTCHHGHMNGSSRRRNGKKGSKEYADLVKLTMRMDKWFAAVTLAVFLIFCLAYWTDLLRSDAEFKPKHGDD